MMNRRKAREYAFILLFEHRFQPEEVPRLLEETITERQAGDQADYLRQVVEGAVAHEAELDKLIADYAKGWSVDRISHVCMAVMRLACYEMLYVESIPMNVSINEAVALAKLYEGEESVGFVNGVLGNIKEKLARQPRRSEVM